MVNHSFSREDGMRLLNSILAEVSDCRLDIKTLVARFVDPKQKRINLAVITCLVSHLIYLERAVDCEIAKAFLPWQTDERMRIRVQTPITVHIGECRDCRNDIETLTQLNLNQKQLVRV